MTNLLKNLRDSALAVPALFKEYRNLICERQVDFNNDLVKQRIIKIYCFEVNWLTKQLSEQLGLFDMANFPRHFCLVKRVTAETFAASIETNPENWQNALAAHNNDDQVQQLVIELLSLPLELTRLIASVKGDYSHLKSKIRPEDIEGTFFIQAARDYLRSEREKRNKNH